MKVAGIICEYNPFHNGHQLHIDKTKEIIKPDVLVCVMSSNFVQRGEPAIINKWERAKVAIENGVDLVLELPFIYSVQSANHFAYGACEILKLAQISDICFGSESNNVEVLKTLASSDINLKKNKGESSAQAYERLYGKLNANDILGLNYIKCLNDTNINIHTIQRTTDYHDKNIKGEISSATSIREAISKNEQYNKATKMILDNTHLMQNYYPLIQMLLLTMKPEELNKIFLMDEGIENMLVKNAKTDDNFDDFLIHSTSKRYTASSIKRTLTHLMNHTLKEEANNLPSLNYIRVLAYNDKGKTYLKYLKKQGVLIASKFNQIPEPYRSMELKASFVYAYPLKNKKDFNQLELNPPIYVKTSA